MAITADDIHNQSFSIDRKGYDVDEVDIFLEHVADEIDALNNQVAALENQLEDTRFDGFDTPVTQAITPVTEPVVEPQVSAQDSAKTAEFEQIIAEQYALITDLQQQLDEKKANDSAISQALIIAQRSADEILAKANAQAADTIQDARDEATRILNRADNDKQAVLDAIRKLEDDREDAREEYQDLLREFIADASRKLNDLGGAPRSSFFAADPKTAEVEVIDDQATSEFDASEIENGQAADYATPQSSNATVAAATPVASAYEKDLSGFGDADDFEFEEID